MPKRDQNHESDGACVEDAPTSKKAKRGGEQVKQKAGTTHAHLQMQKDEEGAEFWELSRTRRVAISHYRGATMINIREYYEKDGKSLPGKKGISLSIDQFSSVLDVLPQIENVLQSKGISVSRPRYRGEATEAEVDQPERRDEAEEPDEEEDTKPQPSKLEKFKMRPNHAATDDEDGD